MAVVNTKSAVVTNLDATPIVHNSAKATGGRLRVSSATIEAAVGDSATSTYRMLRLKSSDSVKSIRLFCDAAGATGAADIGLYAPNGGAVVDADIFGSAVVMTAALVGSEVAFESASNDIANVNKTIWELLGLSTDPGVQYDLTLTLTAAHANGGTITVEVLYAAGD